MPNLFPTEGSAAVLPETQNKASQVKFGRSWRFDFEAGDFITSPTGKTMVATEEDAWLEWCQKAILTERYKYLIYSRQYGQEFADLIRRNLPRAANESEIKRIVTEALKVDQRTASVDNFTFTWDGDQCFFTCLVTSIRGTSGQLTGKVVTW